MRLAIIVTEFPKTTETFILRDLVEFHKRGHEVRIYHLTSFRHKEVVHGFAQKTLEWTRPQPYLFGRKVLSTLFRTLFRRPGCLLRIIGRIVWEYRKTPVWMAKSLFIIPKSLAFAEDIENWSAHHVHAEFAGHPATCAWIVGRITGRPYSVSCRAHDIFLTRSMLRVKLAEAAFVRTISEFNCRYLLERVPGLEKNPPIVIHSSVPTNSISPLAQPEGEKFRIQYVGSLEVRKGIDTLLRSLALVRSELGSWECHIIGEGTERGRLERLAEKLGLQGEVRFLGPVPFEEVTRAMAAAHVVAVPSIIGPGGRTEGIPNVVIETLAHQRTVISTSVSGIPELVKNRETGLLVPPGDDRALADALLWIRKHPEEAYKLAVKGRELVVSEFDLSVNVQAQLELFARYQALDSPASGS